ncbi:MAG: hypothetical protein FWE13_01460 [Firmicutes bacterium]|nr:hypothetical protein [Bacillota bacterium]
MPTNIIFIIVLIGLAVLGSVLGFARVLKLSTRGIVGIIISIVICFLIGGAILATPAIGNLVANGNDYFYNQVWRFLGIIHLATIIYFITLFIFVQIFRIIIVAAINRISVIRSKVVHIVNRALGAMFLSGMAFMLVLFVFAVLSLIDQTALVQSMVSSMEGSFLYTLYQNNPIVFGSSSYTAYYPTI